MSKVYIISDLHLGHKGMALHRGFSSVEEQDETIIKNWNSVIGKKDTVWILGDITMEKDLYAVYFARLNGIKKVVLGNHDKPQHVKSLLAHVNLVCGSFDYKGCILTHIPIHPSEAKFYRFNIHGHTHEKPIDDIKYINVSCEALDYTPVAIDDLIKVFEDFKGFKKAIESGNHDTTMIKNNVLNKSEADELSNKMWLQDSGCCVYPESDGVDYLKARYSKPSINYIFKNQFIKRKSERDD